jgi:hypothetical protein
MDAGGPPLPATHKHVTWKAVNGEAVTNLRQQQGRTRPQQLNRLPRLKQAGPLQSVKRLWMPTMARTA